MTKKLENLKQQGENEFNSAVTLAKMLVDTKQFEKDSIIALEQAKIQLGREPGELPTLNIKRKPDSLFEYHFDDFEFLNYHPQPTIKAPIAV